MNKDILNLHLDILDNNRKELLNKLFFHTEGFILGGGTALALYIAHRKSFDFDFFSIKPIPKNLLEKISKSIQVENIANDSSSELTFFTKNKIKVTFVNYPFKPYFETVKKEKGFELFSIKDIAVQKAYTIGRRGEYRDYFDLYTILKGKYINFNELIKVAKKTYGSIFDEKMFLEQLVYFDDMLSFDIVPVSSEKLPTENEVKNFFEELTASYIKQF